MSQCIFCQIISRQHPATILHEDEHTLAFEDIHPQAPTHILVIPKKHISRPFDIEKQDEAVVGRLFRTAAKMAADRGLAERGYRLVMNNGTEAGQTVFHIHLHVLGGRRMTWPPG